MSSDYEDRQRAAAELVMSPTLQKVAVCATVYARVGPDMDDDTAAMNMALLKLVRAVDAGRIQFADEEAGTALFSLLGVIMHRNAADLPVEEVTVQ